MLNEKIEQNKETIIETENLGVSFNSGYRTDDYKSYMFEFFRKQKKINDADKNIIWPFKNLRFSGFKGEILGIIGSNGSGKTTLCKVIAGIIAPDEGTIRINGKVTALFSLGLGFNKELTGRENVYLNGMMLGIKRKNIRRFIDEIHEFSGLGEFMDEPIKRYSSGMKARLGFSIAAFMEPEVLVIDEALNTGDLEFSERAAEKMRDLVHRAKMVVLVTHSIKYAAQNCDRLIWLDKGVIRADGDPSRVVELYRSSVPARKRKKQSLDIASTSLRLGNRIMIEANNLGISYKMKNKIFWALKNVSFQVREGEVVGVIGHNGAGKSTLCKLLTRILAADEGELVLHGETTSLLGYGGGFSPQLSGVDNIYLNGMLLGIPKNVVRNYKENIVSFSGLEKSIDKPLKQYSSGMKARLGFSIAAMLQPDVFIIDEALSTGDMAFQQKASERIQEMIDKAKAVIIVSHSLSFVEKVCTRTLVFNKGRLIFDGASKEAVGVYKKQVLNDRKQ